MIHHRGIKLFPCVNEAMTVQRVNIRRKQCHQKDLVGHYPQKRGENREREILNRLFAPPLFIRVVHDIVLITWSLIPFSVTLLKPQVLDADLYRAGREYSHLGRHTFVKGLDSHQVMNRDLFMVPLVDPSRPGKLLPIQSHKSVCTHPPSLNQLFADVTSI